jgi:hypothetical protein
MATHQCGICETDCTGTRDIAYDICNQWLHFACENLSEQEFIFLKKTSLSYMCYRCLYKDSTYNVDLALQRLRRISEEAFSCPNNATEMALNKQLPSPFTEIGVGPDQRLPSNLVAC